MNIRNLLNDRRANTTTGMYLTFVSYVPNLPPLVWELQQQAILGCLRADRFDKENSVATPAPKIRVLPRQSQFAAKSAVKEPPPTVIKPLHKHDLRPTEIESQLIREMYDWERQSARVQFRMKAS